MSQTRSSVRRIFQSAFMILDKDMYILLLVPLFFFMYPLLGSGISLTGDFPFQDTPEYAINKLWMWLEKGSIDGFEFVPRVPIIVLMYLLSFVNISSELASKAMIGLGFILSSFSFYFSFLSFFRGKLPYNSQFRFSAIIGSLLYAYNVWSFNRIHHWYLWIGYSIFPVFVISVLFTIKKPNSWKYLIFSVFLWSVASTTPHMSVFYGVALLAMFLVLISYDFMRNKKLKVHMVMSFLSIIGFYVLVNMYWIYPYILSSQTEVLTPNYEPSIENLEDLSVNSNFLNALRGMAYWLNYHDLDLPKNSLFYSTWIVASFVIPMASFAVIFLKNLRRYAIIFSGVALIGIYLSMGTQAPFNYYNLALAIPTLSNLVWVFRDADKWSFLILFAYSFLIGMFSYKVMSSASWKKINRGIILPSFLIFLLIGSIFIATYPSYKTRTDPLKPVNLPMEFDKLNEYLATLDSDKVYFIPYPLAETSWKMNGRVQDIYHTHSVKDSIESTEYNFAALNYYNYLEGLVVENRSKSIGNLINPLGTSYLIYHNDTWRKFSDSYHPYYTELLKKLYHFDDLRNIKNIGFYKIFETTKDNAASPGQIKIPRTSIGVLGGMDIIASLNTLPSFNSIQSSLWFFDDTRTRDYNELVKNIDSIISGRSLSYDAFALSYIDVRYIIAPFLATDHHEPKDMWSKSRARDIPNAEYHQYLQNLGIENWNLDYGNGLVITKAMGVNLSVPVEIKPNNSNNDSEDDDYYLYMRYLKNQKGGPIRLYVDNKLVNEIDTRDRISNDVVWGKIGSIKLTTGRHMLTIQNIAGFNAINLFALIPSSELERLKIQSDSLLQDKSRLMYLLEAESNFYNDGDSSNGSRHYLLNYSNNYNESNNPNGAFNKNFTGQFKTPSGADMAVLKFLAKNYSNSPSPYLIKDLIVAPEHRKYDLFTSDFEIEKDSIPLATQRQLYWLNLDKDLLSTSLETKKPIDGKNSLKVELKPGDKIGWNTLSTDYIKINENAYYNTTFEVIAKDVKKLHGRILYFDLKNDQISEPDFMFKAKKSNYERDGTFQEKFVYSILPPKDARSMKIQILTASTNPKPSSYLLDNVKLEEIIPSDFSFKDDLTYVKNKYSQLNVTSVKNGNNSNVDEINNLQMETLDVEPENNNDKGSYIWKTKPFPVEQNRIYNYTILIEGKNISRPYGIASFLNSADVVENSTYANNASNGRVLSLAPSSEIYTRLHIIKPSNYGIALRANACDSCTFLRFSIGEENDKSANSTINTATVSLKDKTAGLRWFLLNNTYLRAGTHDLRIFSDSQVDLDSVIVYEDDINKTLVRDIEISDQTLKDIFSVNSSSPEITEFKKVNPTKYVLNLKNVTKPYYISLAESFDPLWTAHFENGDEKNTFKINSFPLYGVVNGFYVNKTGNYSLVIEYEPQNWFIHGLTISALSLIGISAVFLVLRKKQLQQLWRIIYNNKVFKKPWIK